MKNYKKNALSSKSSSQDNIDQILLHIESKYKKNYFNYWFNRFSKKMADIVGNAWSFMFAVLFILIWALLGHIFHYSDTWQLVINTSTTIITFLIVFLIQNTQNRDTEILNLKIDELIVAKKGARNHLINLDKLSDEELKKLEKEYVKICNKHADT